MCDEYLCFVFLAHTLCRTFASLGCAIFLFLLWILLAFAETRVLRRLALLYVLATFVSYLNHEGLPCSRAFLSKNLLPSTNSPVPLLCM